MTVMVSNDPSINRSKWELNLDPSVMKGGWTEEEDEILLKGVEEMGMGQWATIAKMVRHLLLLHGTTLSNVCNITETDEHLLLLLVASWASASTM